MKVAPNILNTATTPILIRRQLATADITIEEFQKQRCANTAPLAQLANRGRRQRGALQRLVKLTATLLLLLPLLAAALVLLPLLGAAWLC